MNKRIKIFMLTIILVYLMCSAPIKIYAYDFYDKNNESSVNELVTDVYDRIDMYTFLAGEDLPEPVYNDVNNDAYWWPIGSKETTTVDGKVFAKGDPEDTVITSTFGYRTGEVSGYHGGLDIANYTGVGNTNIIAAKDGVVVYPTSGSDTNCPTGYAYATCGGGYGNYVIIQHSNGDHTVYAHLYENSITVKEGESVKQGQVIGKMGSSGSSTGSHLHFEIRLGSNDTTNRVDPLEYVDKDNPRPVTSSNNWSLVSTTLSEQEFIAKMKDYCNRSNNGNFCSNFKNHAKEIYSVSLSSGINPELVVVTAGTEQGWSNPGNSYNYWGIGVYNGQNSAPAFGSLSNGIAKYADVLKTYEEGGEYAGAITDRYNQSVKAGCKSGGYGLPGTLEGMQSVYAYLGEYRYNPGSSGLGGCYYLNGYIYEDKNYCDKVSTCTNYNSCPESSKTTVCEQSDYVIYILKLKKELRFNIFGL